MNPMNWTGLTRMPVKAYHYEIDTHFREGLSRAQETLGERFWEVVRRSALILVKPDGLATAKLTVICDFLLAHGFSVVAAQPFRFDRLTSRSLWQYQFSLATLDRLAVTDLVHEAGTSLLLLLHSEHDDELPATVRLSSVKGQADMSDSRSDTLRALLGQPNRLCSMVHCADEPADLIRELSLLFPADTHRRLLGRLASGRPSAADLELLDEFLARDALGGISLDSSSALKRISVAVIEAADHHPERARSFRIVLGHLEAAQRGEPIPWQAFSRAFEGLEVEVDPWDLVIVGSNHIEEEVHGASKIIANPPQGAWRT